jgi:hypothetical protein
MGVAAVFLDGGYVEKVLHYDFQDARIDFEKLARVLAQPDDLLRAYYYHCLPYQSNPPTVEERERYSARHRFTTKLSFCQGSKSGSVGLYTVAWMVLATRSSSRSA